ncbi:hypothetical protein CLPU_28c00050 [Gottschalkia purinilytica]|uniref:Uncharacterized protein n=1 Tax=Gottschalkia purinilytica TaxID=1503 RepID=A0A0L0W697_GOTPU|nr:efflux RND transporter periplasmic adaptor subunit [Gottschalkia purinilytica]KNF07053.1 hypothetical protein CLPU_28c00050 [Gottschalkia purinilytica]
MKKKIFLTIGILALIGIFFTFFKTKNIDKKEIKTATVSVKKGSIESRISVSGTISERHSEEIKGKSSKEVDEVLVKACYQDLYLEVYCQ